MLIFGRRAKYNECGNTRSRPDVSGIVPAVLSCCRTVIAGSGVSLRRRDYSGSIPARWIRATQLLVAERQYLSDLSALVPG